MAPRNPLVKTGSMSGRLRHPSSGATSCSPTSSSITWGGRVDLDVHGPPQGSPDRRGVRPLDLLVSHARRPLRRSVPQVGLGGSRGDHRDHGRHFLGSVVGVLQRCDHLEDGVRSECIGHLQDDLHVRLLSLWDLGDEHVGAVAVAQLSRVVVGRELQLEAQRLQELGGFAPVVGLREHRLDTFWSPCQVSFGDDCCRCPWASSR
jgi:hypothetical protein